MKKVFLFSLVMVFAASLAFAQGHKVKPCKAFFIAKKDSAKFTIDFFDKSEGNITNWDWNFGDKNSSTLQNPVHQYANAGVYKVSLTISSTDSAGNVVCSDNYFEPVVVLPPPKPHKPDTIKPKPPVPDSLKPKPPIHRHDTVKPYNPPRPPKDSLKPKPGPRPPHDTIHPTPPDSIKPKPGPCPPHDSIRPLPPDTIKPPVPDSLKPPAVPQFIVGIIYPNPVVVEANIDIYSDVADANLTVTVLDQNKNVLITQLFTLVKGKQTIQINTSSITKSGVYYARFNANSLNVIRAFMKLTAGSK